MNCPNCNADLEGELIYETLLKEYGNKFEAENVAKDFYGATKKNRAMG